MTIAVDVILLQINILINPENYIKIFCTVNDKFLFFIIKKKKFYTQKKNMKKMSGDCTKVYPYKIS